MGMTPEVSSYERCMYAGSLFRTVRSQARIKRDNSIFRYDYNAAIGHGRSEMRKAYARIVTMFMHEMYPGGPKKMIVEGSYYLDAGFSEGENRLVVEDLSNDIHNDSRFSFLTDCYQYPCAFWPHDPYDKLPQAHPLKNAWQVIDRNQEQVF